MVMMATVIAAFGYKACTDPTFVPPEGPPFSCKVTDFFTISDIMGVAPWNKLYAIMMTIYSFSNLAEIRCWDDRLSSFVSAQTRNVLWFGTILGMVSGPMIGFYDCYFDYPWHQFSTNLFVVGQLLYIYPIVYILSSNKNQFKAAAHPVIDGMVTLLIFVTLDGAFIYLFPGMLDKYIDIGALGEWFAFYSDFYIRYQSTKIISYMLEVTRKDE